MNYERELQAALEAAQLASDAVLKLYADFQAIPDAPADIATDADRQSQDIILKHLHRLFPGDAYCAEESTASLGQVAHSGLRLWIIDPIDGTRGFARKNGEFSVMVAFVHQGEIGVGVVHEPARQRLTYAIQGGGCWRRDGSSTEAIRCHVSTVDSLAGATLTQSRSRDPGVPSGQVKALGPARVLESYSAGIKLALVSRGEAALYVNRYLAFHDWDICAGHILVTEAGGRVSGLAGEQLRYGLPGAWQKHGLLASNGRLHEAALTALRTVM